jgi:EmrB/QacA subfamily drug resistance transporter
MDGCTSEAFAPAPVSSAQLRSILAGILTAMFLSALDQTIVATALPTMGRELGDVEHLSWVVTAYLLASTVATPLYGKLSDIYGRRVTLLVSVGIFLAGSVACAVAPTMVLLILARALQGLGGGGLIALAQTIIADLVSPRERPRYQVYLGAVFVTASLLGPILGGFFAEHFHWSLIFWINLPPGIAAFWLCNSNLRLLPRHDRRHRLDLIGAGLMATATLTLLLALSWGGSHYSWLSAPILGLVVGSALLWMLFALRLRLAPEPFIPPGVLHNPVVRMGTLAACFGMGTYIGLTVFLPLYFENVRHLSASATGLALIPLMAGTVAGSTVSGRSMAKVAHYKRMPTVGLSMAVLGTGLLTLGADALPLAALEVVLALVSFGMGTVLPVCTVSIQNAVRPHELGTATGTANFFRSLGGALIVAVFGAILLGGTGLSGQGTSLESLSEAAARSGVDLGQVFRWVFAAALVGFALSLGFLLAMEERPLRGRAVQPAASAAE